MTVADLISTYGKTCGHDDLRMERWALDPIAPLGDGQYYYTGKQRLKISCEQCKETALDHVFTGDEMRELLNKS